MIRSFKSHFDYTYAKVKQRILNLKKYSTWIPCNLLVKLINNPVVPLITYGATIIDYHKAYFRKLQNLITQLVRASFKLRKNDSIIPIMCQTGLLDVKEQFKIEALDSFHYVMNSIKKHPLDIIENCKNIAPVESYNRKHRWYAKKKNTWINGNLEYAKEFNIEFSDKKCIENKRSGIIFGSNDIEKLEYVNHWARINKKKIPQNAEVYTDGSSSSNNEQLGYSIVVKDNPQYNEGGRIDCDSILVNPCSILPKNEVNLTYYAELFAIFRAIQRSTKHIKIFTDSTYARDTVKKIQSWRKYDNLRARNMPCKELVHAIWNQLHTEQKKVEITHVRAHIGNKWNEEADTLAKKSSKLHIKWFIDNSKDELPVCELYTAMYQGKPVNCKLRTLLKCRYYIEMHSRWKQLDSQGRYADWLDNDLSRKLFKNPLEKSSMVNTVMRMRMRALPIGHYVNVRYGFLKECYRCRNREETMKHLLFYCKTNRKQLKETIIKVMTIIKNNCGTIWMTTNNNFKLWFAPYTINVKYGEIQHFLINDKEIWNMLITGALGGINSHAEIIFNHFQINMKTKSRLLNIIMNYSTQCWYRRCQFKYK